MMYNISLAVMRYSKDHKSETHARIVQNAAVRLREKGAACIGVADLMKDTGLTHGGFYAHFKSREALIDEAFLHAMESIGDRWKKRADAAPAGEELAAVVNGYLTTRHRDDIGGGCMLPALSHEVARGSAKTRKAFDVRLGEAIALIADVQSHAVDRAARVRAAATIATMVGSLLLARAAGKGDLSSLILEAGRNAALANSAGSKKARKRKPAKAS